MKKILSILFLLLISFAGFANNLSSIDSAEVSGYIKYRGGEPAEFEYVLVDGKDSYGMFTDRNGFFRGFIPKSATTLSVKRNRIIGKKSVPCKFTPYGIGECYEYETESYERKIFINWEGTNYMYIDEDSFSRIGLGEKKGLMDEYKMKEYGVKGKRTLSKILNSKKSFRSVVDSAEVSVYVRYEDGTPARFVSLLVKGTNCVKITDENGFFKGNISTSATILSASTKKYIRSNYGQCGNGIYYDQYYYSGETVIDWKNSNTIYLKGNTLSPIMIHD